MSQSLSRRTWFGTIAVASLTVATIVVGCKKESGGTAGGSSTTKGNVVMLRYAIGSASTAQREQGFLDAIKKSPDIKVTSDNQYAGDTSDKAQTIATNMLDVLREAQGIYCPNESSTMGMLQTLR